MVHDEAGRNVAESNAIQKIITGHFKADFNNLKESKSEPFIGNPRPLYTPITNDKVAKIIPKLQSNKAPEYD